MNEQLNNAIAEILKASQNGVVQASAFLQQQAPDLAKEVIQWGVWNNLFWVVFSPIILLACYKSVTFGMVWQDKDQYAGGPAFIYIVSGITVAILTITFFYSAQELIKCLVAPKLYVIDYVKDLIKPSSK